MTVAKSADIAAVRDSLVEARVQRELAAAALNVDLFSDYSSLAGPGAKEVLVPRSDSFTAEDLDLATPAVATDQNLTFNADTIVLNKTKVVNYLIPGFIELEAKPSYELSAAVRSASALGRSMSVGFIDEMWVNGNAANDVDFDVSLGTSEVQSKILEMIEKADNLEMLDDGRRTLLIRPDLRRLMLQVPDFVRADSRGTSESPLVNGQLGFIYNLRVVVSTLAGETAAGTGGTFGSGNMILMHPESLGFAFQAAPQRDSQKAVEYGPGSMRHSMAFKAGWSVLQGGDLVVRAWNAP